MNTALEIAEYEQEKEMFRKKGIDIEWERKRQAWEALKPIRDVLKLQMALKTKTVLKIEVNDGEEGLRYVGKTDAAVTFDQSKI